MVDVYSFKVKISLTGIKTIYWPIVLLMMARYFGLSEKIIFFSLFVSGSLGGSTGKPFPLNLPVANRPLEEKIILFLFLFFVSAFLDRSTGKPFPLNLPAANSPLFDLRSKALCSAAQLYPVPTAWVR